MKQRFFYALLLFSFASFATQKIAVIGTGYVGLVSGAGLATFGNYVTCADIDNNKIKRLNRGEMPIYEPGLEELVAEQVGSGLLKFTDNVGNAIEEADIIFIAVGTPMGKDGSADLSYLKNTLNTIAGHINGFKIICIKSTVPAGTGAWAEHNLRKMGVSSDLFEMCSNPEFLREGSSVQDFLVPERLVIGARSSYVHEIMRDVYRPLLEQGTPCVSTDIETSELIKYASNAFLAVKISYINEIANLCDLTGAHAQTVAHAMGLDSRIGNKFLNPGPGFGGSCFPKDCNELLVFAQKRGLDLPVVQATLTTNRLQRNRPIEKLKKLLNKNNFEGLTIAIFGLAFKANTDDVRYSPSYDVIQALTGAYATIKAYDPQAIDSMKRELPDITYCTNPYEAAQNADAIIIMTEWPEFEELDLNLLKTILKQPIIVDARNILSTTMLHELGFSYATIGNGIHKNEGA